MEIPKEKIEEARKEYSIHFLTEKFEDKEENRIRKEKLNKLEKVLSNGLQQIKNRKHE